MKSIQFLITSITVLMVTSCKKETAFLSSPCRILKIENHGTTSPSSINFLYTDTILVSVRYEGRFEPTRFVHFQYMNGQLSKAIQNAVSSIESPSYRLYSHTSSGKISTIDWIRDNNGLAPDKPITQTVYLYDSLDRLQKKTRIEYCANPDTVICSKKYIEFITDQSGNINETRSYDVNGNMTPSFFTHYETENKQGASFYYRYKGHESLFDFIVFNSNQLVKTAKMFNGTTENLSYSFNRSGYITSVKSDMGLNMTFHYDCE